MGKAKLSEQTVKNLPAPPKGNRVHYFAGDTVQGQMAPRGFGVRVTANGSKAFVLNYRVGARERRFTIGEWTGSAGGWSVLRAVKEARELRRAVDKGDDPLAKRLESKAPKVQGKTISDILDEHIRLHAKKAGLRTADYIERTFERLIKPKIGSVGVYKLRRSEVVKLLDDIEQDNGSVMADRALAYLRKAFNWYALRDDQFVSPIVAGMARTKPRERARDRTLSDDEIRDVWAALEGARAPVPAWVKCLLLTAQRRGEVANMRWDEIEHVDGADIWVIDGTNYKTKIEHVVPLTAEVRAIIGERPKGAGPFVFSTTNGKAPFSGFSKAKALLDAEIAKLREKSRRDPMLDWTWHDLRRTARTLMSRSGVTPDTAERVLGHMIPGVRGTYDRHDFLAEKRDGLERLAALVGRIVNPPAANVTTLPVRRRKARAQ